MGFPEILWSNCVNSSTHQTECTTVSGRAQIAGLAIGMGENPNASLIHFLRLALGFLSGFCFSGVPSSSQHYLLCVLEFVWTSGSNCGNF